MACSMSVSKRETFFCWLEQQKEHSFFGLMLSARVGRLVVHISTGRVFTRWAMMDVQDNIGFGPQRRASGARCSGPLTISEKVGPILKSRAFDSRVTVVFR